MSNVGCIDASFDDNPATVFSEKIVRARKQYRCCECGETIEKGEKHELAKGLWDGEWDSFRTCIGCANMRKGLLCSWTYGTLKEVLQDVFWDRDDKDDSWIFGVGEAEKR